MENDLGGSRIRIVFNFQLSTNSVLSAGAGLALEFHFAEAHGNAEGDVARTIAGG